MNELTVHAGSMGEELTLHIDWSDHDNIKQATTVKLEVLPIDKPRTLEISIDGIPVFISKAGKRTFV
jgi:hypothetical protein